MPSERGAAGVQAWSVENPALTRAKRDRAGFGPCLKERDGPAADQMLLLLLYAYCIQPSRVDVAFEKYGNVIVTRDVPETALRAGDVGTIVNATLSLASASKAIRSSSST